MPQVDVYNLSNQKAGSVDLSDEVFAAPVNTNLIYEAVRHHMAGLRRGTVATKTRHEVAGSGKKLWRQKGTGRARMGSIRSPLWRHGGTTHGPQPRDYSYRLNRKMIAGALRSALTQKLMSGELKIVSDFTLADHKTKHLRQTLAAMEAANTVLLVDNHPAESTGRNLALAARNLPGVKLVASRELTTYDLLGHKSVLMSQEVALRLSVSLAKKQAEAPETQKEAA